MNEEGQLKLIDDGRSLGGLYSHRRESQSVMIKSDGYVYFGHQNDTNKCMFHEIAPHKAVSFIAIKEKALDIEPARRYRGHK